MNQMTIRRKVSNIISWIIVFSMLLSMLVFLEKPAKAQQIVTSDTALINAFSAGSGDTDVQLGSNIIIPHKTASVQIDNILPIIQSGTLDLNGYTLTLTGTATMPNGMNCIDIASGEKLTIKDSSSGKTGKLIIQLTGMSSRIGATTGIHVPHGADLEIQGGTIDIDLSGGTMLLGAGIGGGFGEAGGNIIINDGNILIKSNIAAGIGSGNQAAGCDVTINGGYIYIETLSSMNTTSIGSDNNQATGTTIHPTLITINGGKIDTLNSDGIGVEQGIISPSDKIEINGGNINDIIAPFSATPTNSANQPLIQVEITAKDKNNSLVGDELISIGPTYTGTTFNASESTTHEGKLYAYLPVGPTNPALVATGSTKGSVTLPSTLTPGTQETLYLIDPIQASDLTISGVETSWSGLSWTGPTGHPASLVGTVSGTVEGTLSYEWMKEIAGVLTPLTPPQTTPTLAFPSVQTTDNGKYYWVVTQSVGSTPVHTATSSAAQILATYQPPTIVQDLPSTISLFPMPNLSVTWTGSWPVDILWEQSTNGGLTWTTVLTKTALATNSDSYTPTVATATDQYRARVRNTATPSDVATSAAVTLTLQPLVITGPINQQSTAPATISFNASVTGGAAPSYTYQWFKSTDNGSTWTPISSATGSGYSFMSSTADHKNQYRVMVTDALGNQKFSNAATYTYSAPNLVISTQPTNQQSVINTNISFNVGVTGGVAPYSYQWHQSLDNGATWTLISGATASSHSFLASASDSGNQYRVIVTDQLNNVATSSAATYTRVPPQPLTIANQPKNQQTFIDAVIQFNVGVTGGVAPYSYQWHVSTDSGSTWTPISSATGYAHSFLASASDHGNQYRVVVTDQLNNVATSSAATYTRAIPTSFFITQQPTKQQAVEGSTVNFNVGVTGGAFPYIYQWEVSRDGVLTWTSIPGAVGPTYTFVSNYAAHWGTYYRVIITDQLGNSLISNIAAYILLQSDGGSTNNNGAANNGNSGLGFGESWIDQGNGNIIDPSNPFNNGTNINNSGSSVGTTVSTTSIGTLQTTNVVKKQNERFIVAHNNKITKDYKVLEDSKLVKIVPTDQSGKLKHELTILPNAASQNVRYYTEDILVQIDKKYFKNKNAKVVIKNVADGKAFEAFQKLDSKKTIFGPKNIALTKNITANIYIKLDKKYSKNELDVYKYTTSNNKYSVVNAKKVSIVKIGNDYYACISNANPGTYVVCKK